MPTQKNDALRREIDAAAEVLRKGGLILYPTDTVWGIGCDATNEEAVARIYALKRSQNKKSMLVLCASACGFVVPITQLVPASPSRCRRWPPRR